MIGFDDIASRYSEPARVYHTLTHIAGVLRALAGFEPSRELVTAAILHDIVYDPRAADNEERSAAYAQNLLSRLSWDAESIERVAGLILATKHHQPDLGDGEAELLVDADLSILGASPVEYSGYSAAVRHEYSFVTDDDFREGRRRILEQFLARPRIFRTAEFQESLEAAARANLSREIAELGAA